ncbi:MAG: hypothetical protein ACRBEQ_09205 [Hyphomonas sp.]
MHLASEHAVGLGITIGLIFVTGVASGAGLFTGPETIVAIVVSVILGFMPVATLFSGQNPEQFDEADGDSTV